MLNTDTLRFWDETQLTHCEIDRRMRSAADEIDGLRTRMVELLDILRNWEPDNASAEERRTIMQAMYQTGILIEPTETLRNMTEADFVEAHGC